MKVKNIKNQDVFIRLKMETRSRLKIEAVKRGLTLKEYVDQLSKKDNK